MAAQTGAVVTMPPLPKPHIPVVAPREQMGVVAPAMAAAALMRAAAVVSTAMAQQWVGALPKPVVMRSSTVEKEPQLSTRVTPMRVEVDLVGAHPATATVTSAGVPAVGIQAVDQAMTNPLEPVVVAAGPSMVEPTKPIQQV